MLAITAPRPECSAAPHAPSDSLTSMLCCHASSAGLTRVSSVQSKGAAMARTFAAILCLAACAASAYGQVERPNPSECLANDEDVNLAQLASSLGSSVECSSNEECSFRVCPFSYAARWPQALAQPLRSLQLGAGRHTGVPTACAAAGRDLPFFEAVPCCASALITASFLADQLRAGRR